MFQQTFLSKHSYLKKKKKNPVLTCVSIFHVQSINFTNDLYQYEHFHKAKNSKSLNYHTTAKISDYNDRNKEVTGETPAFQIVPSLFHFYFL